MSIVVYTNPIILSRLDVCEENDLVSRARTFSSRSLPHGGLGVQGCWSIIFSIWGHILLSSRVYMASTRSPRVTRLDMCCSLRAIERPNVEPMFTAKWHWHETRHGLNSKVVEVILYRCQRFVQNPISENLCWQISRIKCYVVSRLAVPCMVGSNLFQNWKTMENDSFINDLHIFPS